MDIVIPPRWAIPLRPGRWGTFESERNLVRPRYWLLEMRFAIDDPHIIPSVVIVVELTLEVPSSLGLEG